METLFSDFSACQRVLSSRWMLPIMTVTQQSIRFGDIQQSLDGLSRGVLAAQLQALTSLGLVSQKRYTCFPPRVEYLVTEKGRTLMQVLSVLPTSAS